MRWFVLVCGPLLAAAVPRFDSSALLKGVLVPADAAIGSVIYRLRASDSSFDYPLVFSVEEKLSVVVTVQNLNCTRFNSVCQANVVLRRRLEIGRFYDFVVIVRNQRNERAKLECSFKATNATTPLAEIFPGAPTLLTVAENATRNTELGKILARGNPAKARPVLMELFGPPQFGLYQRLVNERDAEATVLLLGRLDYEKSTVHHLTIYANDPYTEIENDTRNIAGWPLLVAVLDIQDTPPVFTLAPPTTVLKPTLKPGDEILRVHAEDGDRGSPRTIKYGLLADGNPYASFFNISEETGVIRLVRPLADIQTLTHSTAPIVLSVVGEEVRQDPSEPPAQSTVVHLALIPPGFKGGMPHFSLKEYRTRLDENSPPGTVLNLTFPEIVTQPGDVVTLELANNNDTFDVSPSVIEGRSQFEVKVRNPVLLDYEARKSVECDLVAKELGSGNFSSIAHLIVILNDVNDNKPVFTHEEWYAYLPENAEKGTMVVQVQATDPDVGLNGRIKYTRLLGSAAKAFDLNASTGVITVLDPIILDAESNPLLEFAVEAADENGDGLKSTTKIIVNVTDINDVAPEFEKNLYEFILHPDRNRFTVPAFVKAIDRDLSPPNNQIHYELLGQNDNITIDETTGELSIRDVWSKTDVVVLKVRAWDGGVPRLNGESEVRIYPPESHSRRIHFIVPGSNPDREYIANQLREITGARVTVDDIRPYTEQDGGYTDKERSVVTATVRYSNKDSVVDVNRIQQILDKDYKPTTNHPNKDYTSETTQVEEAGFGSLWWILILLIILLLLLAAILILCCICEPCPLYVPPRKRKITSSEVARLVVKGSGQGKHSKSVQVAEWFGRKEAWSPEAAAAVQIDGDAESLRRHEMERGSDRGGSRRPLHRQHNVNNNAEPARDQFYIREGNAEILRLITRGGEQQRPITLMAEQPFVTDSGKEILMHRFIEQQQAAQPRSHQVFLPNSINKLQTENELLEASLRQQNALLRQIILEREREMRLETQSLPAGTQTDQDAGTQTEPRYLLPSRRKVRSDNDASDFSDEETQSIRAKSRKRYGRRGSKASQRRKITTPILEESESNVENSQQREVATDSKFMGIKQTRTSLLRQKKAADGGRSAKSTSSTSRSLKKEVLREISASLTRNASDDSNSDDGLYKKRRRRSVEFSDDSLEDYTPRSDKTADSLRHRYHSESDLRNTSSKSRQSRDSAKSLSQTDLRKPKRGKRVSRYMDWYKKCRDDANRKKPVEVDKTREGKEVVVTKTLAATEAGARKTVVEAKVKAGPEHPLLQHSEHRFEAQYPLRRPDEDADSGIVLAKPPIAQKKSVFTIAYDDMHTSQLRPDSSTP